ncbi:MAG: SRPBCC family protein [Gammaproteobacteria bacterium]|nr:SRPBCC family protein [Gammaproteobacteria bacterium]
MAYKVLVDRTIPVSRSKVFACLMDFGGINKLLPDAIESCELQGSGVGAVRTIKLKGTPGTVVERLDCAYEQQVFAYSIVAECPLPLEYYHANVTLADAPNGGCRVAWGSNWTAKGAPEAEVVTMLTGMYNGLIDQMAKL